MLKNKVVRVMLALCLALIPLVSHAGCVKKTPETETDVEIVFWRSGVGAEYIKNIEAAFEKKHPEIKLHITVTADVSITPLYSSPEKNTVDLYMAPFASYLSKTEYLEPLNEVLDAKPDGGDVTIKEKIGESIEYYKIENTENYYVLPYAATANGLTYNADIFSQKGFSVPRTTQELTYLCADIVDEGLTPFMSFTPYWDALYSTWMAQLDGVDAYFEKWSAIYTDENGIKHENDVRSFTDYKDGSGRREAAEVLYSLVSPEKYVHYGSNTYSHTDAQTRYLNGTGVMMPNGSWLANEMKGSTEMPNIRMMKTPVISALKDKIGITENQLRAAVSVVDGDATDAEILTAAELSKEQMDAVREARNIIYTQTSEHTAFIPNYASAKEAAKTFLKYYYSDEALKIFADTTNMPIPASLSTGKINTDSWADFGKDGYSLVENSTLIFKTLRSKIFYAGGISDIVKDQPASKFLYSRQASDMWSVDDYVRNETTYWNENWKIFINTMNSAG